MNIKNFVAGALVMVLLFSACKKTEMMEQVRLFRPVIAGQLVADSNAILVGWQAIKAATSYTVQLSRDTFRTIDLTVQVPDTNRILITDLRWDQLYQVQVKALAADTIYNSRYSFLGAIKTPKFPTILNTPGLSDVSDEAIRMSWRNEGAAVTSIKVLLASDSSLVREVMLTATDVNNMFRIINGLKGATTYIGMLYSGTRLRGADRYTTKAPISGKLVDLRGITGRPSVLADTLPLVENGSVIILKRGENYDINSTILLDKSITIRGGTDISIPDQPMVTMASNFNLVTGTTVEYVNFIDVFLKGTDAAAKYVFNISNSGVIGRVSFENVRAESFRGIFRSQGGVTNTTFSVNNSIMSDLGGYGVITVDNVSSKTDSILITNSTIYKADKIITSRSNSVHVAFRNNTVNEAPLTNNYLIDYNTSGSNNVTNDVVVRNNILGVGRANTAGVTAVKGIRVGSGSIVTSNNYSTADYNLTATSSFAIPDLIAYTRPSTQLWVDAANGNFKIADASFPATATAGDPRWK